MFTKFRHNGRQIVITLVTAVMLCGVIALMIGYIYNFSEKEAFEDLYLETQQIKNDISIQMLSDRENLSTMASFASKLYSDGDSFELLFKSYQAVGLIENIGILLPDDTFITKAGTVNTGDVMAFKDEVVKGEYISGRVMDVTNSSREVVRSAVPIKVGDETVAILYGSTDLATLAEKYYAEAKKVGAELYLLEGESGRFIVDTKHGSLGNITALAAIPYKSGFSYDRMVSELSDGVSGYSAFYSQSTGEAIYVHYAPVWLGDWQIMLSKPDHVIFAGAKATGNYLGMTVVTVALIMIVYVCSMIAAAKKKAKVDVYSAIIRKQLLGLNIHFESIHNALKSMTEFSKSRSSFFVDTYGEDYNDVLPSQEKYLLRGEDRAYFIEKLMGIVSKAKKTPGVAVQVIDLSPDKKMLGEMPEFYQFMKSHGIKNVHFAGVTDNSTNVSLIGVVNPKNHLTGVLLKEIAVCFAMAVYNKKHLTKTEAMALTDSLTGLANRMAYKQEVKSVGERITKDFACIYIDVNELHYFNNRYGHAAGDQMLVFIAETLRDEFSDSLIYRMGGDEFLIFTEGISRDVVKERLGRANELIEEMKYHVSVGIAYMEEGLELEELVKCAEKKMYSDKAKYYQDKELVKVTAISNRKIESMSTGIKEVDACLSILSNRYLGAYCVSLGTDKAVKVLAPSYFMQGKESGRFSEAMKGYIYDLVKPEYQRMLMKFLDYEVLEGQLRNGNSPMASYIKIDGEKVVMRIFMTSGPDDEEIDTVWIFEKEDR